MSASASASAPDNNSSSSANSGGGDEWDNWYGEETAVVLNEDLSNCVVIDNTPKVDESKYGKLCGVLKKVFSKFGKIEAFDMPMEEGKTLGYCFVEYETAEQAALAAEHGDKKKLDKKHTLRVNLLQVFDEIDAIPEEFTLKKNEFQAQSSTWEHLFDEFGRDQYVVRQGHDTEVYWNDPSRLRNEQSRELVYAAEDHKERGKAWTEMYVKWSPMGQFLATFHTQGIVIWGGDGFKRIQRFSHPGVKFIDFSPKETYLVTCNGREQQAPNEPECIIVWNLRTGRKLRGFTGGVRQIWPNFSWSPNEDYITRLGKSHGKEVIQVYDMKTMKLLDKKSIKVENAGSVQFSPREDVIVYWVPPIQNRPAKVSVMAIPSREIVREKHLYDVTDIKVHWHPQGTYLAVKMTRKISKTRHVTSFEIFRMKMKDTPIETLDLDTNDNVTAFAWEPHGHRFAIVSEKQGVRSVSFHQLKKKKLVELGRVERDKVNCLFWSPLGGIICLAGLGEMNGQLEFYDVKEMASLARREHYMATTVEWDPSGRFVLTAVCQPLQSANYKYLMDNGYRIWSYDGKGDGLFAMTTNVALDRCYQVLWRPRPPTPLDSKTLYQIRTALKDPNNPIRKECEKKDEHWRRAYLDENERRRLELEDAWKAYERDIHKYLKETDKRRKQLIGHLLAQREATYELREVQVEEVLDEQVEELE